MTAHVIIGSIAAALSLILGLFFVSVGRAPGWRHYRTYSLVAVVSCLYALVSLFSIQSDGSHWQSKPSATFAYILAMLSGVLWLRFDSQQEQRDLEPLERIAIALLVVAALLSVIPGLMLGDWHATLIPLFDMTYHTPSTTWVADGFIAVLLLAMGQLFIRYAHRAWNHRESWLRVAASFIFIAAEVEEGLTATGITDWPFLGPVGFSLGILLMAIDLGGRVAKNANNLARLNEELEARIARRTEELVVAREALLSTERHVALGQLAAGVGHEVNNPLSYVQGNLDYLQDQLEQDKATPEDDEGLAAIADALHGTNRIRLVVDNLVSYARSAPVTGAANVAAAVDVAIRVVRPQSKFAMLVAVELQEVPPVAVDESKLIQVLVNLLINSAQACESIVPRPTTTISAWHENDEVVIEVVDHGCGMPDSMILKAIAPPSLESGNTGLGIYLCFSIIEATGGQLQFQSKVGSGTTAQLRLKATEKAPPSIAKSARRPSGARPAARRPSLS